MPRLSKAKKYPCPLADKYNCRRRYTSKRYATKHSDSVHLKITYPCPLTDKYNCDRQFTRKQSAKGHAKSQHLKITFPCPLADEFHCKLRFTTTESARRHTNVNLKRTYPCPLANEYDCDRRFASKRFARCDAETQHLKITYPCPVADEYNCDLQFTQKENAKRHAKLQHLNLKVTFPCPLAEEIDCSLRFSSKSLATRHAERLHWNYPYPCTIRGCSRRLQTREVAAQHEKDQAYHPIDGYFLCPVPNCRTAVQRQPLRKPLKKNGFLNLRHMLRHQRMGDLTGSEVLRSVSPYKQSRCELYDRILQWPQPTLNQDREQTTKDRGSNDAEDDFGDFEEFEYDFE